MGLPDHLWKFKSLQLVVKVSSVYWGLVCFLSLVIQFGYLFGIGVNDSKIQCVCVFYDLFLTLFDLLEFLRNYNSGYIIWWMTFFLIKTILRFYPTFKLFLWKFINQLKFLQIQFGFLDHFRNEILFLFDHFRYVPMLVRFDMKIVKLIFLFHSLNPILPQIIKPLIQPINLHLFKINLRKVNHVLIVSQWWTWYLTN